MSVMPRASQAGLEAAPQILVEAAQDAVAAIDDRGVDAQPGEDRGELDRDIAAALDQDRMRQRLEIERLVGGDAEFGARECRA